MEGKARDVPLPQVLLNVLSLHSHGFIVKLTIGCLRPELRAEVQHRVRSLSMCSVENYRD